MTNDYLSLIEIIRNSCTLFKMELGGLRITIPYFIQGLFRILPTLEHHASQSKAANDSIQYHAYKLIASMLSSLNRFSSPVESIQLKLPNFATIDGKLLKIIRLAYETAELKNRQVLTF